MSRVDILKNILNIDKKFKYSQKLEKEKNEIEELLYLEEIIDELESSQYADEFKSLIKLIESNASEDQIFEQEKYLLCLDYRNEHYIMKAKYFANEIHVREPYKGCDNIPDESIQAQLDKLKFDLESYDENKLQGIFENSNKVKNRKLGCIHLKELDDSLNFLQSITGLSTPINDVKKKMIEDISTSIKYLQNKVAQSRFLGTWKRTDCCSLCKFWDFDIVEEKYTGSSTHYKTVNRQVYVPAYDWLNNQETQGYWHYVSEQVPYTVNHYDLTLRCKECGKIKHSRT